jgi:hypothetical protein
VLVEKNFVANSVLMNGIMKKIKKGKILTKTQQGKKNRKAGRNFELKVRKNLESKGLVVSKWMNQVEFMNGEGKLVPAKHKFAGFGRPLIFGSGFPDFIVLKIQVYPEGTTKALYEVIGVEAKTNGYLDKDEKNKCLWLLKNQIFSKILIASKNDKEIIYKEFGK